MHILDTLVMIGFYEQFIKKLIACLCHDPISQIFPNADNLCKSVFMKLQIIYNSANLLNNCFTNSLPTQMLYLMNKAQ